ncbi:MAG TPA: hypothetical protein VHI54_06105 [Actinomycetota bacterium]|nr:hypothetical protein [Actinomycetota bacterium]
MGDASTEGAGVGERVTASGGRGGSGGGASTPQAAARTNATIVKRFIAELPPTGKQHCYIETLIRENLYEGTPANAKLPVVTPLTTGIVGPRLYEIVTVHIVFPYTYNRDPGSRDARIRAVIDPLVEQVERRLKASGLLTPAFTELRGFPKGHHLAIQVEKRERFRVGWRRRQRSRPIPDEQVVDEVLKLLDGVHFPGGSFLVTMNENWHEKARLPLSPHQNAGRLP